MAGWNGGGASGSGPQGEVVTNIDATWRTATATGTWTGSTATLIPQNITVAGVLTTINRCLREFGVSRTITPYYHRMEIVTLASGVVSYGMMCCATDENNGYVIESSSGGANGTVYKFVAGVATPIGALAGHTVAGDVLQVDISSSTLIVSKWTAGVRTVLGTIVDGTFAGTRAGPYTFDAGTNVFRNFVMG